MPRDWTAARANPRREKTCEICGQAFVPPSGGGAKTQKFCSIKCRGAAIAGKGRACEAHCETCGSTFMSRPTRLGMTRFCSMECGGLARRVPRDTRTCKVCGATFETARSRTKRTCSRACATKAKAVAKTGPRNHNFKGDESVKAREARWHASRASYCVRCSRGDLLQLHHVIYRQEIRRRGGDELDPRDGLTLCAGCHASHHKNLRENTLPLVLLRDENYAFALELMGAGPAYEYLRRRYGGEDVRLVGIFEAYRRTTNERLAA